MRTIVSAPAFPERLAALRKETLAERIGVHAVLQRLERIADLPAHVQTTVLKSLDLILQSGSTKRRETIR